MTDSKYVGKCCPEITDHQPTSSQPVIFVTSYLGA